MDDERDDATLLHDHVTGDPEAFTILVRRHRDRLWSIAVRTMRNEADAADALQDALLSACRRASQFKGNSAVTTWLHRIVVNACLDKIRRNKVRATETMPEDPDRALALASEDSPERSAEQREMVERVEKALGQINAEQRAALILVDMHGYPVDQAAQILGCAVGTVKSRCARGRAKLAPLLADVRMG